MPSVKGNIILNLINTALGLLFPLITFPYVSRILMPEGIGQIQFYQSIINYISLLTALGIPLYAVREIARVRDDIKSVNKTTVEILTLHSILCLIGYIVVFILCTTINKIHSNWILFLILSLSLFFNVIGVAWFYQAIEEFKYITIRSLIVRCVSLISLFIFVRTSSDLYIYAVILVGGQFGNYSYNFYRLRKYKVFTDIKIKELSLKRHLYASLRIFVLNVAISLYINVNPIMLGFMTNDACVGYYTAVTKIINVINGITTAIGAVILPRLSNYFAVGKDNSYQILKNKTLDLINIMCLPMSICLIAIAPVLIPVFAGQAYIPSVTTLMISAPTILISALNYIIAIQILYTQNKEHFVIIATLSGGVINIIINLLLIPHFQQNGTALSGLTAELCVLIISVALGYKYICYNFYNRNNIQALCGSVICAVLCWIINKNDISQPILLITDIAIAICVYILFLMMLHNKIVIEYKKVFLTKIKLIFIKA